MGKLATVSLCHVYWLLLLHWTCDKTLDTSGLRRLICPNHCTSTEFFSKLPTDITSTSVWPCVGCYKIWLPFSLPQTDWNLSSTKSCANASVEVARAADLPAAGHDCSSTTSWVGHAQLPNSTSSRVTVVWEVLDGQTGYMTYSQDSFPNLCFTLEFRLILEASTLIPSGFTLSEQRFILELCFPSFQPWISISSKPRVACRGVFGVTTQ